MTVIVGVRCTDGIVIGADSAATASAGPMPLLRMGTDKLQIVGGRVLFGSTGSVGLSQRLHYILEQKYKEKLFAKECLPSVVTIAKDMIKDMQQSMVPYNLNNQPVGWSFGALLAAEFKDGVELIEFATNDFQPEVKKGKLFFGSMGSGQMLADPFLSFVCRVLWENKQPTVEKARLGVHWALSHTIQTAPGGVGDPIRIGLFSRVNAAWECRLLEDQELQEQAEFIQEIEGYLRRYPADAIAKAGNVPPPPVPAKA